MKIYLYNFCENRYTDVFDDKESLINFLVSHTHKKWLWRGDSGYGAYNKYLDNINVTGNDTYQFITGIGVTETRLRPYMFITENNSILDARLYWDEVKQKFDAKQEEIWNSTHVSDDASHGDRYYRYRNLPDSVYYFRETPVPGTGHKTKYRWYFRSPKTYNEKKHNSDVEYKKYVRPSRNHLPTLWDDICRGYYKSWKHCTKKRKQWM